MKTLSATDTLVAAPEDGVSVTVKSIMYATSTDGTTPPSSGWTTGIPTVPEGGYLWTKITFSSGDPAYMVSKQMKNGTSVTVSSIKYAVGSSATSHPTSGWSTTFPSSIGQGKYLWVWTVYSDGTSAYSVSFQGNDGESVTVVSTGYAVGYSGTVIPVSGWSSTVPAVPGGCYLWTRVKFSNGEYSYTCAYHGKDGSPGSKGYPGARMRMREWSGSDIYFEGKDDEEWYDVVEYNGLLYLCVQSHLPRSVSPQEDVAGNGGYWEAAQHWTFVATKLLLSERIKSGMIDTDDLVAKRIYTDPVGDVLDEDGNPVEDEDGNKVTDFAHVEIAGSEMKVFNKAGLMNIRFGVNEDDMAVMEYYDNEGRKLYDLGPGGITMIPVSEESWTKGYYQRLGSTVQEVLTGRAYKTKAYSEDHACWQYHSKKVAGVVDDADNDGKWFLAKGKTSTVLPDGIYRQMPTNAAANHMFLMWISGETGVRLTSSTLTGLSAYNEPVYDTAPIYVETLYVVSGGRMSISLYAAYWNGSTSPIA